MVSIPAVSSERTSSVARLEGEVMLQALARHAASIRITGTPVRAYNNTLRGLHSLPLHIIA